MSTILPLKTFAASTVAILLLAASIAAPSTAQAGRTAGCAGYYHENHNTLIRNGCPYPIEVAYVKGGDSSRVLTTKVYDRPVVVHPGVVNIYFELECRVDDGSYLGRYPDLHCK